MKSSHFFFIAFLLQLVIGCQIETAAPPKKMTLRIASTFLEAKDSVLFKSFAKSEKIAIQIVPISLDSIRKDLQNDPYNNGFDLVLLNSSFELHALSKRNLLQEIPELFKDYNPQYKSSKNDWITIGLDPYILSAGDSNEVIQTYNDLIYGNQWKQHLDFNDRTAFYASILRQFGKGNRSKAINWIQKMQEKTDDTMRDSVSFSTYYLDKHSNTKNSKHEFVIPHQSKSGAFYDIIGIGIPKQSTAYGTILNLLEFYHHPTHNQRLNAKLNTFPIENPDKMSEFEYQNDYPILFRCSPLQATQQYNELLKISNRLKL